MKKIIIVTLFYFISSCTAFPDYYYENNVQNTGVDFTQGKWLLNQIQAPYDVRERLTELVLKDFSKNLKNRLVQTKNATSLLLPNTIGFNPNKEQIKNLKKGTNYDYFINIKSEVLKDEISSVDFTNHKQFKGAVKEVRTVLEIYDLNLGQIIYSKNAIGRINIESGGSEDVRFSSPSRSLILRTYKKIIKDINKKSIH